MNIIKYLAELISNKKESMVCFFFCEILVFFAVGYSFNDGRFLDSFLLLLIGFIFAFVLGEAIRIRARRGD